MCALSRAARKVGPSRTTAECPLGMNAWCCTAIDFRTGKTIWEQLAGRGRWSVGYWPVAFIGPNGALYEAGNGRIFAMKDTR